jgi:hypothetical protein
MQLPSLAVSHRPSRRSFLGTTLGPMALATCKKERREESPARKFTFLAYIFIPSTGAASYQAPGQHNCRNIPISLIFRHVSASLCGNNRRILDFEDNWENP